MPRFIIEREIPGAGALTDSELKAISQNSLDILCHLGTDVRWLKSYVTEDKMYCEFLAPDEAVVLRHAELAHFPANRVAVVHRVIDPRTAG